MEQAGMRIKEILGRIKIKPAAAPDNDSLAPSRPVLEPSHDHQAMPIKSKQIESLK
jgi:hypothetical protein